jgi:SAM-dependent methyltransferase
VKEEAMPDWNSLFKEKANRWEDPYEDVVTLADSGYLTAGALILDLGCGAGRHLKFLESRGYKVVGMDLAPNGLHAAKEKLLEGKLAAMLDQADMSLPFPYATGCFDCVISIHVIFHNPKKKIKATLAEMGRVLKPGGFLLVTFNSAFSSRCGKGIKIEDGTWLPDIGVDRGIPHHFSSLKDVADLMDGFKVTGLRLEESIKEGAVSSHWVVTAQNVK